MYSSQLDRYDIAMHSSRVEYYMSIVSNKHNHNVSGKKRGVLRGMTIIIVFSVIAYPLL